MLELKKCSNPSPTPTSLKEDEPYAMKGEMASRLLLYTSVDVDCAPSHDPNTTSMVRIKSLILESVAHITTQHSADIRATIKVLIVLEITDIVYANPSFQ